MNYKETIKSLGGIKPNVLKKNNSIVDHITFLENTKKLEKIYNKPIPKEYLSFLHKIGGFTFKNPVAFEGIDKIPVSSEKNFVHVDNFFDLSNDDSSILSIKNDYKGNLSDNLLPIAEGEAGDLVVINMSDDNYEKIYYWHHEHDENNNGIYLLANNFNQLISNLRKVSENDVSTDDVSLSRVSNKFLERLRKSGKKV